MTHLEMNYDQKEKKEICRAHKNEKYFGEFDTHGISGSHERHEKQQIT